MPEHLYEDLPEHFLQVDEKGRKVPDYLRMILMCEYCSIESEQGVTERQAFLRCGSSW